MQVRSAKESHRNSPNSPNDKLVKLSLKLPSPSRPKKRSVFILSGQRGARRKKIGLATNRNLYTLNL